MLLLFFIIKHVHELLKNFLIFRIDTHINFLVILLQSFLLISTSTHKYLLLFDARLVGGDIDVSLRLDISLVLGP